jgi:hypothetical protein
MMTSRIKIPSWNAEMALYREILNYSLHDLKSTEPCSTYYLSLLENIDSPKFDTNHDLSLSLVKQEILGANAENMPSPKRIGQKLLILWNNAFRKINSQHLHRNSTRAGYLLAKYMQDIERWYGMLRYIT